MVSVVPCVSQPVEATTDSRPFLSGAAVCLSVTLLGPRAYETQGEGERGREEGRRGDR